MQILTVYRLRSHTILVVYAKILYCHVQYIMHQGNAHLPASRNAKPGRRLTGHRHLTGTDHTPIWPVRLEKSIEPVHRLVNDDDPPASVVPRRSYSAFRTRPEA